MIAKSPAERVLVVDDDDVTRGAVAGVLGANGHLIETAASAAEARGLIASGSFALVICDMRMPGEPGDSLARWLRDAHPDVAVLMFSGLDDVDVAETTLALGAYGYLTKPLKPNELTISVTGALRRRRGEIDQRASRERLEESYRRLVDRLPAIVYLWEAGADGQCYYVSPAIESILGYAPEEWLADPHLWANRLHPSDRERVVAEELRCRETGDNLVIEYRIFARDGKVTWIRDEGVMLNGESGLPHHIQGLMYDVTAEKAAQASLRRSQEETVRRLARAAELRDDDTGAHIERMSRYCELIAARLGLDPEEREQIRIASPMHDVGKIGISDAILRKPGPLTPEERAEMERHAEAGYRILAGSGSDLLDLAATIAWTHHERFDGSGYPRGLEGAAIPLHGRIAAVADVFDALTSDRVYRPAYSPATAVDMMVAERGAHFDPRVLDAFLSARREIEEIRRAP